MRTIIFYISFLGLISGCSTLNSQTLQLINNDVVCSVDHSTAYVVGSTGTLPTGIALKVKDSNVQYLCPVTTKGN